jgi:hypothetical protein
MTRPALLDDAASDEIYLAVPEAAAIPKINAKTLYRWIATDPTLPALKVNGTVRIPKRRFLLWLRRHEQGQAVSRRSGVIEMPSARADLSGKEAARARLSAIGMDDPLKTTTPAR